MLKSKVVYISESFLPEINVAFEEYLMEHLDAGVSALMLWQNQNTIVVGRHQNPLKECNLPSLEKDQVKLVRRLSGGGAVYHDLGNLNFTFIGDGDDYNVEKQMQIVLDAVASFGIQGELSGRNDLVVSGKKFSGNAFYSQRERHCHHGTLLVDVDVDKLSTYLTVSDLKIKSKGVDSVRSRVVNLKELNSAIDIGGLKQALIDSFNRTNGTISDIIKVNQDVIEENMITMVQKYKSKEWNYTKSPIFEIEMEEKFEWGIFAFRMNVANGVVKDCEISTDSIIEDSFEGLQRDLTGALFAIDVFREKIRKNIKNKGISENLLECFSSWMV